MADARAEKAIKDLKKGQRIPICGAGLGFVLGHEAANVHAKCPKELWDALGDVDLFTPLIETLPKEGGAMFAIYCRLVGKVAEDEGKDEDEDEDEDEDAGAAAAVPPRDVVIVFRLDKKYV